MYAQLGQTIQAIKTRAVFQRRDITSTPMASVLQHMKNSSVTGQANIEDAAVQFYLSNHGFHLIEGSQPPSTPLSPAMAKLAGAHVRTTSAMALRMFHYLLTISVEEAAFGTARSDAFFDFVESSTSPDAAKWLRRVMRDTGRGSGNLGSAKDVGAATLGECCKAIEMCFRFAQWGPGYGGLPWAQIAETAGEVVRGTNSLELMIDKAFTLSHNNGAIFNKGHQFTHYDQGFYSILDIQASGQMPAAVHAGVKVGGFGGTAIKALHHEYAALFPEEFRASYDPSKVKSMEKVRAQKAAAAAAKAHAFHAAAGGYGAAPVAPSGPPKRPCDELFSVDDLAALTGGRGLGF